MVVDDQNSNQVISPEWIDAASLLLLFYSYYCRLSPLAKDDCWQYTLVFSYFNSKTSDNSIPRYTVLYRILLIQSHQLTSLVRKAIMSKSAKFGSRTSSDTVLNGKNLSGKNIIITGANTGIGYEAARALAAVGANITLACRNDDKGLAAVANIKASHPNAKVEYRSLDLSSVASIKSFSEALTLDTIDTIICNAGVVPTGYQETAEGIEQCVGVCHFGHFALCKLLLPKVLKSKDPRIVMVSSESHRSPKTLNFEKYPLNKNNFAIFTAYGQAKLSNALFANELQRRFGKQGLSACSLHPGALISTDIGRNSGIFSVLMKLISPLTKNPNQGASTTVYCAAYARREEIQGQYFSHCKKVKASKEANDPAVASKLWDISEAFCEEHGVV